MKKIFTTVFPAFSLFSTVFSKETWKTLEPAIEVLKWTFKLWLLTIVIPISLTLVSFIFIGILGVEVNSSLPEIIGNLWSDYYVTGSFLEIAAWRWHLGILFCCFLFTLSNE